MIRSLLIRWALLTAAFAITEWLLSGITITGGFWAYVWVAAIFGVVNAIVGTILRILTLPLTVLTLGLFSFVVTALMLELTDALTSHLTIDHFFWTAIWAAIILAVVSVVLDLLLAPLLRRAEA